MRYSPRSPATPCQLLARSDAVAEDPSIRLRMRALSRLSNKAISKIRQRRRRQWRRLSLYPSPSPRPTTPLQPCLPPDSNAKYRGSSHWPVRNRLPGPPCQNEAYCRREGGSRRLAELIASGNIYVLSSERALRRLYPKENPSVLPLPSPDYLLFRHVRRDRRGLGRVREFARFPIGASRRPLTTVRFYRDGKFKLTPRDKAQHAR